MAERSREKENSDNDPFVKTENEVKIKLYFYQDGTHLETSPNHFTSLRVFSIWVHLEVKFLEIKMLGSREAG